MGSSVTPLGGPQGPSNWRWQGLRMSSPLQPLAQLKLRACTTPPIHGGAQSPHPPPYFSDFWAIAGDQPQPPSETRPGSCQWPQESGTQAQSPPLPSFQGAVSSGAMTQRPLQPTGPVSCPPRCGGSLPTTATRGVSGAVAGALSPLSCSSSGSPHPHLLAPCGSVSALFLVPRRDHLQPPRPPGDRPAPPSCPRHPPWPAAAQPCPPQPASSWSPTGPLTPGPCLPRQPVATSPPTVPVLTQSPRGPVPAASLPA